MMVAYPVPGSVSVIPFLFIDVMLVVLVLSLLLVVSFLLIATIVFVTGITQYKRFVLLVKEMIFRLYGSYPYIGVLIGVLVLNKGVREIGPQISWLIGWNITGILYGVEGPLVSYIQNLSTPWLTAYFSFVYIYVYVFILVIPFAVYLTLEDQRYLRRASVAFTFNYLLGMALYILFISYGPRNIMPELVEPLLYSSYPNTRILTAEVNSNTNVFPSLHTSLSATVLLLSWETRDIYPRFFYAMLPASLSVIVATMYLGIHWVTDVFGGIALAVVSVYLARKWASKYEPAPSDAEKKKEGDKSALRTVD